MHKGKMHAIFSIRMPTKHSPWVSKKEQPWPSRVGCLMATPQGCLRRARTKTPDADSHLMAFCRWHICRGRFSVEKGMVAECANGCCLNRCAANSGGVWPVAAPNPGISQGMIQARTCRQHEP